MFFVFLSFLDFLSSYIHRTQFDSDIAFLLSAHATFTRRTPFFKISLLKISTMNSLIRVNVAILANMSMIKGANTTKTNLNSVN
ncbi:hypothetical protein BpHYR1_020492 [Brachionus plicatilis]|uniref:Uncharacterized protein n=1 Tax=Brachionus plicatilis TaxID=10195 RepID=A0A3M7P1S6_BRAPC|nr:hypothetical protein BpHYR1_020492 [Brachionus plicatilis]